MTGRLSKIAVAGAGDHREPPEVQLVDEPVLHERPGERTRTELEQILTGLTLQLLATASTTSPSRTVAFHVGSVSVVEATYLGSAFIRSVYSSPERSGHHELNPS